MARQGLALLPVLPEVLDMLKMPQVLEMPDMLGMLRPGRRLRRLTALGRLNVVRRLGARDGCALWEGWPGRDRWTCCTA